MQQQRELRRRPGCETSSNCYLQRQTFALFKQLLEFSVQTILFSFCRADIFMHARESDSETNTNVRWCKVFSSILFRTLLFGDSQSARGLWICYLLAVGESKRAATFSCRWCCFHPRLCSRLGTLYQELQRTQRWRRRHCRDMFPPRTHGCASLHTFCNNWFSVL